MLLQCHGVISTGVSAVLEKSTFGAAMDVCYLMRRRAEDFEYGVEKQSYDKYSEYVRKGQTTNGAQSYIYILIYLHIGLMRPGGPPK